MATYRKKPSTIEAVQVVSIIADLPFYDDVDPEPAWVQAAVERGRSRHGLHAPGDIYFVDGYLTVHSPSGPLVVQKGDWIAYLNPQDIYVIRADQFEKLYEPVT